MDDIIKLKENKSWLTDGGPRFMLTINKKASEEQKKENSYDILSKLIGNSNVIMELNGSLLNLPPKKRDSYTYEFIEDIKALGLEYRCSRVISSPNSSLLNLFGKTKVEDQVVAVYIPNEIWSGNEMLKLISFYGAKYFVIKEASGGLEMLEQLQRIKEADQVDHFKLIAFDAMCLNAMGIFTKDYELSDIKAILGF